MRDLLFEVGNLADNSNETDRDTLSDGSDAGNVCGFSGVLRVDSGDIGSGNTLRCGSTVCSDDTCKLGRGNDIVLGTGDILRWVGCDNMFRAVNIGSGVTFVFCSDNVFGLSNSDNDT